MTARRYWTVAEDDRLMQILVVDGATKKEAALKLNRSLESINKRMRVLNSTVICSEPEPEPEPSNESPYDIWAEAMK